MEGRKEGRSVLFHPYLYLESELTTETIIEVTGLSNNCLRWPLVWVWSFVTVTSKRLDSWS